jgi:alpha-beta hydrolase superfamily lysophospholipase
MIKKPLYRVRGENMSKREEFTYDSRDGESKIHAVQWTPDKELMPEGKPYCIVQIVHGMKEYALRYDHFANYLTEQGIVVVANDHLGHGLSVREGNPHGYMCEQDAATVMVRDVHRLKKMTQQDYAGVPYIIIGHSMGSFVLRNYLTRYGTGINGAIIVGTGWHSRIIMSAGQLIVKTVGLFYGAKHQSPLLEKIGFKQYMKRIEHPQTDKDWICSDEKVVAEYIDNPMCNYVFTVNGLITLMELTKRAHDVDKMKQIPKKLPILIASGTQDPVGAWGEAPKRLYDTYLNLDLTKTQLKLYNGDRHEILNETDKETVYLDFYNWIANVVDCL